MNKTLSFRNHLATSHRQLSQEHLALVRQYAQVQRRCSDLLQAQAAEIARLQAEQMRLHARLVIRDTALMWAQQDMASMQDMHPGLERRRTLLRRIGDLMQQVQQLVRERNLRRMGQEYATVAAPDMLPVATTGLVTPQVSAHAQVEFDETVLEEGVSIAPEAGISHRLVAESRDLHDEHLFMESLAAADMVICQTGCVSQGDYWRVQDHCRRTGKMCVMIESGKPIHVLRKEAEIE
ncbi:MAG: DUF2325 domain-containing protein [Corticimicrobacter sp.]|uniref:DUF2325 domain-containing protein n=1 Tax=Corticimicrobacter sp. TaxID=2678536 RepID=UPI0032DAB9DD